MRNSFPARLPPVLRLWHERGSPCGRSGPSDRSTTLLQEQLGVQRCSERARAGFLERAVWVTHWLPTLLAMTVLTITYRPKRAPRKKRKQPPITNRIVTPAPMKKRMTGPVIRLGAEPLTKIPASESLVSRRANRNARRSSSRSGYLVSVTRWRPTPDGVCVLVWCKACHHQAPADLQAIIDRGLGDVPLRTSGSAAQLAAAG
jgi:hypothetical protein